MVLVDKDYVPILIEDRALKRMLKPQHFNRKVAIPRARVNHYASNITNLRRSASARYPSQNNRGIDRDIVFKTKPIDVATIDLNYNRASSYTPTKVVPIDIATLTPSPPPKSISTSRELVLANSRSVSQSPQPTKENLFPSAVGGGSFLYSGNFDPNSPNSKIITKPVPLPRKGSLNLKNDGARQVPQRKPLARPKIEEAKKPIPTRNPLAKTASTNFGDDDEVDFDGNNNKFDDWAEKVYEETSLEKNKGKKVAAPMVVVTPPHTSQVGKARKSTSSVVTANSNWSFGPTVSEPGPDDDDEEGPETLTSIFKVDEDEAVEQALQGFDDLLGEGGVDIGNLAEGGVVGIAGKLGGKAGGKLGGKIGKKLGNEELGEQLGEEVGEVAGEIAGEMAMDAAGDLLVGEGVELEPPDASKLCAKCSIQ